MYRFILLGLALYGLATPAHAQRDVPSVAAGTEEYCKVYQQSEHPNCVLYRERMRLNFEAEYNKANSSISDFVCQQARIQSKAYRGRLPEAQIQSMFRQSFPDCTYY